MKKILMFFLLLAFTSCTVGPKCTYTQDGTKIESWLWFYKVNKDGNSFSLDKPADLDKMNCN